MTKTKWTKKYYIGRNDNGNIYLSAPKWDCGWYWGFGYLGNANCHYHLDGLASEYRTNMYDALIKHFDKAFIFKTEIEEDKYNNLLWQFCELVSTAYSLKETAEVLGRGGAHYTTNPLAELIKNEAEVKRINETVLPAIFDKLDEVLARVSELHEKRPRNMSLTSAAI